MSKTRSEEKGVLEQSITIAGVLTLVYLRSKEVGAERACLEIKNAIATEKDLMEIAGSDGYLKAYKEILEKTHLLYSFLEK